MAIADLHLQFTYDDAPPTDMRHLTTCEPVLTLWWLRRGSVQVTGDHFDLKGTPGDWLVMPPLVRRHHAFSDEAHIVSIRWSISVEGSIPLFPGLPTLITGDEGQALEAPAMHLVQRYAAGAATDQPWDPQPYRLQGELFTLFGTLMATLQAKGIDLHTPRAEDPRLALCLQLLTRHSRIGPLPWDALEGASGLSRSAIDRLFRRNLGVSASTWQQRQLLSEASPSLRDPNTPPKAVAATMGCPDPSNFTRWFKGQTGMTPAAFKRQAGV